MQVGEIQFAPVITPRMIDGLARAVTSAGGDGRASALNAWKPVLYYVINSTFVPITRTNKKNFWQSYHKLSRQFQPFRLCINLHVVALLGVEFVLRSFPAVLEQVLEVNLASAKEKHISPERLREVLQGYMEYIRGFLGQISAPDFFAKAERLNSEDVSTWYATTTQFDYALTALFLVLEDAMPSPSVAIIDLLHSASEKSLDRLALFPDLERTRALEPLEQPVLLTKKPASNSRGDELKWLEDHRDLVSGLAGNWIVLEGGELVAKDPNYEQARKAALARGIQRPFIVRVPDSDDSAFMGI